MIVYRDQRVWAASKEMLSALRLDALQLARSGSPNHEAVVELLIGIGTLEAGLDDVLYVEADGVHPMAQTFREASCALGRAVWHSWRERELEAVHWVRRAADLLGNLEAQPLPARVQISVPEGYAYYAVYPEMYLEAARRCHEALAPHDAVCLGLRSIGTSLSAAVAGALQELGCTVSSFTLRPRGHPFARRPVLDPQLHATLQSHREALFLIVDEGPGISGSSLSGTAELLSEIGVEDRRIVLFPSWSTDGSSLQSARARDRWQKHRQFVMSFEAVWLDSGRLCRTFPPGRLRDFSAGAWRDVLYGDTEVFPPVQQQHERRKYLLEPFERGGPGTGSSWFSFVGLGERGRSKLLRARQLAEAGFTSAPEQFVQGFLVKAFAPGTPVNNRQGLAPELLEALASYLAYIAREHRAEPSVTDASLSDMMTINVEEGLGSEALSPLERSFPEFRSRWCEWPVALDGRMQPHEWIRTNDGYLKTDAVDHHDDHFFPGCQDIAWDVAATCLEFELDRDARQWLIERYRELSGDRSIAARLPVHAITYLAFRLGYTTLAASTLGETPDRNRFVTAAQRYRQLLRRALRTMPEGWDA